MSFRTAAILMALLLFLPSAAFLTSSGYGNGDTIEFGSYPQSRISEAGLIESLNAGITDDDWTSFGYYYGDGTAENAGKHDYMYFTDVVYAGRKYRGIRFDKYRPSPVYEKPDKSNYPPGKKYELNTVYWFGYEPVIWQMLDNSTGLMICRDVIDCQPFDNTGSNEYESSSVKQWLNNDFYDTAFGDDAKACMEAISGSDRVSLADIVTIGNLLNNDGRIGFATEYSMYNGLKTTGITAKDYCANLWVSADKGENPGTVKTVKFNNDDPPSYSDNNPDVLSGIRPVIRIKGGMNTYTVRIYKQKLTGGYEPAKEELRYTLLDPDDVAEDIIKGYKLSSKEKDGTVFTYFYDRESYTLTYEYTDGSKNTEIHRFGEGFSVPEKGNAVLKIISVTPQTSVLTGNINDMPPFDFTIRGEWLYRYGILRETLDGSEPEAEIIENKISPEEMKKEERIGFELSGEEKYENRTLILNYRRRSYTVSYLINGEEYQSYQVRYEAPVPCPDNPEISGYEFTGWDGDIPGTMPAENLTFNAILREIPPEPEQKQDEEEAEQNTGEETISPVVEPEHIPENSNGNEEPAPAVIREKEEEKENPVPSGNTGTDYVSDSGNNEEPADNPTAEIITDISIVQYNAQGIQTGYKATVTFHATVTNGNEKDIVWYDGNGNEISRGESCRIKEAKESYSVKAKVVINGNTVAESEEQKVTVKTGLFEKIRSFFLRLFGSPKYNIDRKGY